MKRSVELRVSGAVHGVGLRWTVREYAQQRGLVGYVRNEDDGSVTVVAEGEESDLRTLVSWLRRGAGIARVARLKERWGESRESYPAFTISR